MLQYLSPTSQKPLLLTTFVFTSGGATHIPIQYFLIYLP